MGTKRQAYIGGIPVEFVDVNGDENTWSPKIAVVTESTSPLNVKLSSTGNLVDLFSRLRTAEPFTVFDSKQIVDNQPLFWDDQVVSGSGTSSTYNSNQASTTLAVSTNTAGTRVRQTFQRHPYQPGKAQLVMCTGVLGAAAANITRRIGLFDTQNGVFWQLSGSTLSVVKRSFTTGSAVDTVVNQADWNIDRLDGAGPSGIIIDTSKTLIYGATFEWLGVGTVLYFVVISGQLIPVHQMHHSNVLNTVYMSTPNLPLRFEISNSGTGVASSLVHICSVVISEGGQQETGINFHISRGSTGLATNNNASLYPLIAIRLKTTHQGAHIHLNKISVICTTSSPAEWQLILNPTVTGTALSFTGITNSAIEADVARTNATTVSDGTVLSGGYFQQSGDSTLDTLLPSQLRLGASIAGVSDILVLAVRRLSNTAETYYGSIDYREIF